MFFIVVFIGIIIINITVITVNFIIMIIVVDAAYSGLIKDVTITIITTSDKYQPSSFLTAIINKELSLPRRRKTKESQGKKVK